MVGIGVSPCRLEPKSPSIGLEGLTYHYLSPGIDNSRRTPERETGSGSVVASPT